MKDKTNTNLIILGSRLLRFVLGGIFAGVGIIYGPDWPVIIFGGLLFLTGFLRPRRCVNP